MNVKPTLVPISVHTIVTHKRPHIDEIVAIKLLKVYGRKVFLGIEKARVEFWDAGSKTPDGKSWKEWTKNGYLLVGVGGSCFDEHPAEKLERKEGHCAASLVAKYLGIENYPELQQLLKYTIDNDTNGGKNPFDLAAIITAGNKEWFETDPNSCLEWALQSVTIMLNRQIKFFSETKKEFEMHAYIKKCLYQGREITLVAIESDNTDVGAYARSEHGASAQIVLQRNSKHQVTIITQNRARISLDAIFIKLVTKEKKLKGTYSGEVFTAREGSIPGVEEWYYDLPARRILNGSLSAPNVKPTRIPFEMIVDMVVHHLNNSVLNQQGNNRVNHYAR
jgi:hypothetical protein